MQVFSAEFHCVNSSAANNLNITGHHVSEPFPPLAIESTVKQLDGKWPVDNPVVTDGNGIALRESDDAPAFPKAIDDCLFEYQLKNVAYTGEAVACLPAKRILTRLFGSI